MDELNRVPLVADLIDVATRLNAALAEIRRLKAELAQAREATRVKHLEAVWLQAKLDNAEVQR